MGEAYSKQGRFGAEIYICVSLVKFIIILVHLFSSPPLTCRQIDRNRGLGREEASWWKNHYAAEARAKEWQTLSGQSSGSSRA